jgi:alpha-beta hydrolase superfamily lysophospholipase
MGNLLAKSLARIQGKEKESKLMNELAFSSFNKQFENAITPFDWLSSDVKEVRTYVEDPYCGFIPTHQFFKDLTDGLLLIHSKEENKKIRKDLPVLFISGSADPVGNNGKGVFQVAEELTKAGLQQVAVYLFEGMRHEILNEQNKELVYEVIVRWLRKWKNKNVLM